LKDAMEVITTKTTALRISTTSIKQWVLYGPIDQALKTSIQTKAVKGCTLSATVHDQPMNLVLWVSADPSYADDEEERPPNMMAMTILAVQKLRDHGETPAVMNSPMGMMIAMDQSMFASQPPIYGPAILTGAGGENLPEGEELGCIFHALMGQDD
jgi:hypothetical protein